MTKYYTEGIWGGLGPSSGELNYLVILKVEPETKLGWEIIGECYDPFVNPTELTKTQSGLDDDKLVGPSVLCKWSD